MLQTIKRVVEQVSRRIHMRVIIFAMIGIAVVAIARPLAWLIPPAFTKYVGAEAVDQILSIIASSMLAVTTFSLTIMTGAFARASSQWTPRSHLFLREDTVTHSVLSTFLGAYLFALSSIILRATGYFDDQGLVVLFGVTLAVVAAIVFAIIRWIVHLEGLGSFDVTARMLEDEAAEAMDWAARCPCNGARALIDGATHIPSGAVCIKARETGYIQQIFEGALQTVAESVEGEIFVVATVGRFVQEGDPLAFVDTRQGLTSKVAVAVREAIPVRNTREFTQDPIFGVTVLGEVATRALSPGVNDPGTAIDILHRLGHVIGRAQPIDVDPPDGPQFDRVHIRPLDHEELFQASIDPILRCAGDAVEVHIAGRHALESIIARSRADLRAAAQACADRARHRADVGVTDPNDRARLKRQGGLPETEDA